MDSATGSIAGKTRTASIAADDAPIGPRLKELAVPVHDPSRDATCIHQSASPVLPFRRPERRHLAFEYAIIPLGEGDDVLDVDGGTHGSGQDAFRGLLGCASGRLDRLDELGTKLRPNFHNIRWTPNFHES